MLTRYLLIGLSLALAVALAVDMTAGGAMAALVMGFMAGNFACSLIHRLPRKKSILENKPYCGECAHPLTEMDLLPVFGSLLLKHRCRYCGVHIPYSHLFTELLIGALFVTCFLLFNYSELFLLVGGIGIFLIILSCIEINDKVVMPVILLTVGVMGMILRTYVDGTIFGFLQGGLFGFILGMLIWRREVKPVNHIYTVPDGAKLLAMAGICAGAEGFFVAFILFAALNAGLYLLRATGVVKRVPLTVPVAIAIMAVLLVPGLNLSSIRALF